MSNTSRGNELERRAVLVLESHGYAVARAHKVLSWASGAPRTVAHDHFGCFDVVALHREHPALFLQVTTRGELRRRQHKVEAFATEHAPESADVEVWAFVAGRRADGGQRFARTRLVAGAWTDLPPVECVVRGDLAPEPVAPPGGAETSQPMVPPIGGTSAPRWIEAGTL